MKKLFLSVLLALACVLTALAQDIITTKDGNDIEAKILEVNKTEVKYKKFNNLDGPVFTMAKSDILIVRYENGEKEIFKSGKYLSGYMPNYVPNTNETVVRGMRYGVYKRFYDPKNYIPQPNDRYSPGWSGFASFVIPGLGQAIVGEWGRGAAFFLGNITLGSIMRGSISYDAQNRSVTYPNLFWYSLAANVALNIYSIFDAIHVAKVKNMYYQDLYGQIASVGLKFEPYFAFTPSSPSRMQPTAGLSLKMSF